MKSIIKNTPETQVGYEKRENSKYISDSEIERMSKEQKHLRLQIQKCQNHEQIKQLRKSRKKILKQISYKINDAREKLAEDLVGEVENAKDDTKMFKAAKALYTRQQRIQFVHDEQDRSVSQPQEIQRIIEWSYNSKITSKKTTQIQ